MIYLYIDLVILKPEFCFGNSKRLWSVGPVSTKLWIKNIRYTFEKLRFYRGNSTTGKWLIETINPNSFIAVSASCYSKPFSILFNFIIQENKTSHPIKSEACKFLLTVWARSR